MASLAQGSSCSFAGVAFTAVSVRVESPTAELADMTGTSSNLGTMAMMPTGGVTSPGSVTVEVLSPLYPGSLVKRVGPLAFGGPGIGLSINCVCTSVSVEAKVGDLIRSTLTFVPSDYYG